MTEISFHTLLFKLLGDPEFNYFHLCQNKSYLRLSFPATLRSRSYGPVFSYCARRGLDGGERFRGGGPQWKQNFYFLNCFSGTAPFCVLMFHCCGLSLWATATNRPQRRDRGRRLMGAPRLVSRGILSLYGGWREGRVLRAGWVPQGWVVWTSAKCEVSARDSCLLGNTIISANKNCLHSHKQIILRPGWLARSCYGNYFG